MYDPGTSTTAVAGVTGYTNTELVYGSTTLKGSMRTDSMATNSNITSTAVTAFGFFMITQATGLDGLDGILGFSPINPTSANTGPSYVKALYD